MKILKDLYDWVLSWSNSRWGPVVLLLMAIAEASFFPIPPDVLLIGLALGNRKKAFYYSSICLLGSVSGGLLGYGIGTYLWWNENSQFSNLALFFFNIIPGFNEIIFYEIQNRYELWDFWIIFTAGFTPIPYKIITISAGAFDINFIMFFIASIVGRGGRFFLLGFLIWKFGDPIKIFIDKYFNLLAIIFTLLLIGGFIMINYFID